MVYISIFGDMTSLSCEPWSEHDESRGRGGGRVSFGGDVRWAVEGNGGAKLVEVLERDYPSCAQRCHNGKCISPVS